MEKYFFDLHQEEICTLLSVAEEETEICEATVNLDADRKNGTITCFSKPTNNPYGQIEIISMIHDCAVLLGLHIFPHETEVRFRIEEIHHVNFFNAKRTGEQLELMVKFIESNIDSNKTFHRLIYHFNVQVSESSREIATAKISLMFIATKNKPQ